MSLFNLKNKQCIKACKPILHYLFTKQKKHYIDLFFYQKQIAARSLNFNIMPLIQCGIVSRINDDVIANVQVFPLSGKFICTDFLIAKRSIKNNRYIRKRDDVWAILPYESPYLAKKAIAKKGDVVLDLATGSGIIALLCADKAKKVIATDINPKALNYAQFNAILNDKENIIEFREGNLFEPVKGLQFDLIIWNGPTISVPNARDKYPIYCFGGIDGLEFTRKFIAEAPRYLNKQGKIQWLEASVGNAKTPESLEIIKREWKNKPYQISYEQRVEPSDLIKTIKYLDRILVDKPIRNRPQSPLWIQPITKKEYNEWLAFLQKNNYTHIYAGIYTIIPNTNFRIRITHPDTILFKRMNHLPAEYQFLSYQRIIDLIKICESY